MIFTKNKEGMHKYFSWLSITGGLFHLLIVSFLHYENFIELWFFAVVGLVQIFLGIYVLFYKEKSLKLIPLLVIVHGSLVLMWAATRIFPAPFSILPEVVGSVDVIVVIIELLAVFIGLQIVHNLQKSLVMVTVIVTLLAGVANYVLAKSSENIFLSIPVNSTHHEHFFWGMFQESTHHEENEHHDEDMDKLMNSNAGISGSDHGQEMDGNTRVPHGHSDNDDHHN